MQYQQANHPYIGTLTPEPQYMDLYLYLTSTYSVF
jgi:hypothetical protein